MYGETEVDSGDVGVFNLGTISQAIASAARSKVTDINLKSITLTVNPIQNGQPLKDVNGNVVQKTFTKSYGSLGVYTPQTNLISNTYTWEQDGSTVRVDPITNSTTINNPSPIILSVGKKGPTGTTALTTSEISQQFALLSNRAPRYVITTTNGVEVISTEFSKEYEVDNFYLADADEQNLKFKQNTKLSVNARDGVVVLTNSVGNPIGFPTYSEFTQPANVETSFSSTMLKWNLKDSGNQLVAPPDGLQWGFYNIATRQFLGTKLSYQYYVLNKNNIYIAVHAFDADRDVSTMQNVIGVENRVETLKEFSFPSKSICPIYSVKVSPRAKIAISSPPNNLSKFDTWFINLSRGRFYKKIEVPISYNFVDWRKNYKGLKLRCFYDTTSIKAPFSELFGTGYYDIWEENPIIVSSNEIELRHGSFLVVQEQVNKEGVDTLYTDASQIVPWFDVEIKDSSGQWQKINTNLISGYDKHTGRISFSREIVPSNEKNIRVNYTVKNPNLMMYHINGKEIPLNPYVNMSGNLYDSFEVKKQSSLEQSKPIHFYIVPSLVEQLIDGEYVRIADYVAPASVVNYTTNYDIFTQRSINYDPFAIYLGSAVINNTFNIDNVQILDLRVKGGGVSQSAQIEKEIENNTNILSFNDIKAGRGKLYPNGGYVIVRIPEEVKNNFRSIDEIYSIVRSNLTAGVAFDIQDMNGKDWKTL